MGATFLVGPGISFNGVFKNKQDKHLSGTVYGKSAKLIWPCRLEKL